MRASAASLSFLVVLGGACSSPKGPAVPPFRHQGLYERLQGEVGTFSRVGGDYKEDYGDAAFYAVAFYARSATAPELAAELHRRNSDLLATADFTKGDVNELAMSMLGAIEYLDATQDRARLSDLDRAIASLGELIELLGHHVPESLGGNAAANYGPTSINALLALIGLQRAFVLGGDGAEAHVARSAKMAAQLEGRAWNGTFYEFSDGKTRPGLFLYPNVSMILVNTRLFQLTGKDFYRKRALAAFEGMQPLRVTAEVGLAGPGRYRSPYSAASMGAKTDDYSTLSSQNYLAFALMLLYELEGDVAYLELVDPVFDFIDQELSGPFCLSNHHRGACQPACVGGQVCREAACASNACGQGLLHHFMDGRIAQPEDPEYVCSGCNFQTLYVLWYRQHGLRHPR